MHACASEPSRSERAQGDDETDNEAEITAMQPALIPLSKGNERIGICRNTAYAWIAAGDYPGAVRCNGRWYVRVAELDRFLSGRT